MAFQSFKIESKSPSLITAKNAEGKIVNISINKQSRTFLALERQEIGADVNIDVEVSNKGNLMCVSWTKHDQNRAKALAIEAQALTSELAIKKATKMLALMDADVEL